ncbi:hypothetical protein GYH30_054672 [Glycine max]|uniref:Helitron helicase-like domain-containing protein n=1 Tax=Glycine max TaxID=3847 RepID=K7N167_SOYBN|nr:hypothetical protein GYH30_054672 [Glycine max]
MVNNPPKFAQLYIYDTDNEVKNRLAQNPIKDILDEEIIIGIKNMLDKHNRYAQKFRMARDKLQSLAICDLKLKLISDRQSDERLYNLSNTVKVAALIVGDEHTGNKRDIIIEKQTGVLKRINELHPAYLSLQYPLLYPKGEDDYRSNILHKDHLNIHAAKRKKSQKLNYVRQHQQELRVDKYMNLNACNNEAQTLGNEKGKRIILPNSFIGSQRYMKQLYFDGMTICVHIGFPDLFLTLTYGFLVYRRRNNRHTVQKNGIQLDNRFVVPYSPHLLLKYRTHLNVEWCNQSTSIKYLFKYINRGSNQITIAIVNVQNQDDKQTEVYDEIKHYLDCQYVSII